MKDEELEEYLHKNGLQGKYIVKYIRVINKIVNVKNQTVEKIKSFLRIKKI